MGMFHIGAYCWHTWPGASPRSFVFWGRIHRHPTHLPPKFSFSSDFGHFILKMVENAKFSYVSRKKKSEIKEFLGTSPADFSTAGDASPRPPAFDAHVHGGRIHKYRYNIKLRISRRHSTCQLESHRECIHAASRVLSFLDTGACRYGSRGALWDDQTVSCCVLIGSVTSREPAPYLSVVPCHQLTKTRDGAH